MFEIRERFDFQADNMTRQMQAFEAREGGAFRMPLIYSGTQQSSGGKTAEHTDTFQGQFVEMVPDEKISDLIEFESREPRFAGKMKMTINLADAEEELKSRRRARTSRPEFGPRTTIWNLTSAAKKRQTLVE